MKNLTLIINGKDYDLDTHILSIEGEEYDQVRISGRLRLPMFDTFQNDLIVDILESRINENGLVIGDFDIATVVIKWAIDLTDDQRYQVITKG